MRHYILDEHNRPLLCEDIHKWADWFTEARRIIAKMQIDGVLVSTIFLGMDCGPDEDPPILYETMVFGGKHDGAQRRCSTLEQAALQHLQLCKKAFGERVIR